MGNVSSGNYSVDVDGAGPLAPYSVFCDMVTDGGGWTLVARSVSAPYSFSFGWKSSTGSVTDDTVPYSLGVVSAGLEFTEILFGSRSAGKAWGAFVYKHAVPTGFLTTHDTTPIYVHEPQPVFGGNYAFGMAGHIGYTSDSSLFFFRDHPELASYGMNSVGWATAYASNLGGQILNEPGMIMVR